MEGRSFVQAQAQLPDSHFLPQDLPPPGMMDRSEGLVPPFLGMRT